MDKLTDNYRLNIVFLDADTVGTDISLELLSSLGNLKTYAQTSADETIKRSVNADVLIVNKVMIDAAIMNACPQLKLICVAATGVNNIDLEAAEKHNITVKNVAGYSTESVVQTTFSSLLALIGQTIYFNDYVQSGLYTQSPIFTHFGKSFSELNGKQFGIIGMGTIGKRVAEVATAFGAYVVYYSTSGKNNNPDYQRMELDKLMSGSDIICIHAPLNDNTKNLITRTQLRLMKPTAFLTNMGRGGIVNEADLAQALNDNILAGAALDVFEREPMLPSHPFLSIRDKHKLILSPHIAWASIEARKRLIQAIAENIRSTFPMTNSSIHNY